MKIIKPNAQLLWVTPNAEATIERAGRVCYKSEDKITHESSFKFIKMLLDRKHEAVLEHACASILFICDRGVTHELVRHRLASYCQESTRYCNYGLDKFSNEISIIEPPQLSPEDRFLWEFHCKESEKTYLAMISEGVSPQIARSILPTCLKTEIVVTTNFREWRHILKLRTSSAAHPQIREIMEMALKILKDISPTCFEEIK
jgi:thymidylate synthase (FAD)